MNTHEFAKAIKLKETKLNRLEKQFSKNISQSQAAIFDSLNSTTPMFKDTLSQFKIIEGLKREIKADREKLGLYTLAFTQGQETERNLKLNI